MTELISETVYEFNTNRERIKAILRAIKARREADKKIPNEWIDELTRRLEDNGYSDSGS